MLIGLMVSQLAVADEQIVVVDPTSKGVSAVSPQHYPVFSTIADALTAAPGDSDAPYIIRIRNGVYLEKLSVDRPGIWLEGESREETIIRFNDTGESVGEDGQRLGTAGSYTLRVRAEGFRAENLSIENSFDYTGNAALPDGAPGKVKSTQAVALMLAEGSDRAVFRRVNIIGHQDTLFADAGRSYFFQSRISGHVDFIFGAGQAVFEDCDIVSRHRPKQDPSGFITAPSTLAAYPFGFLFLESRLLKESAQVPAGSVRLGRPWHPGGNPLVNGTAVFRNTWMDDHIGPEGYAAISSGLPAGERVWFELGPNSRFFEYDSHGPGAIASKTRPVLGDRAASWYTRDNVLNHWRPATVFLAGDSTMAEKRPSKRPETGWGEMLQPWLGSNNVRVSNHAMNGRSTRTFIEEGRWQAIVSQLSDLDYVVIQFGHNDQAKSKPERYTTPDQYRENLRRFVREVRGKGATPVLLTPVMRRRFDESGAFYDTHGVYPGIVRELAEQENVALLDLHRASEQLLREYGEERSSSLFLWLDPGEHPNYPDGLRDNTHFSPAGAEQIARLAAWELARMNIGLEISGPTRP